MNVTVKCNRKIDIRKGDTLQRIAEESVRHVAKSVCCPVHGEYARVERDGKGLKLAGCCDELLKTVFAKMK